MDAASQSAMASKSDKERTRDASPTRRNYAEYRARLAKIERLAQERKKLQNFNHATPATILTYADNGKNADFDAEPFITIQNKMPDTVILRLAVCGCAKYGSMHLNGVGYCKIHARRPFDDSSESEGDSDGSSNDSSSNSGV